MIRSWHTDPRRSHADRDRLPAAFRTAVSRADAALRRVHRGPGAVSRQSQERHCMVAPAIRTARTCVTTRRAFDKGITFTLARTWWPGSRHLEFDPHWFRH